MMPFAINNALKLYPKYEKADFASFAPTKKLVGFYRFTDDLLMKIVNDLGLSLTLNAMKHLQKYFIMGNPPSILALKILDKYWSSGYGCLNREISQIEIATDNPHIYRALDLYNELRAKYNITAPRTLNDILFLSLSTTNDAVGARGRGAQECECYDKGVRTHYYTDIVSSWNDDKNGALHRAILTSVLGGGTPLATIREELGGYTEERVRLFAEYAEELELSALGAHGEIKNETLETPVNKASVLNLLERGTPYSGDLLKGDRIYLVTIPNTEGDGIRQLKSFITLCNAEKIIARAYSSDGGILRGLLEDDKGFDIFTSESNVKDLPGFISDSRLNRIVIVVHKQNAARLIGCTEKYNFSCSFIGRITDKPFVRIFSSATEVLRLSISLLKYRSNEFCVARITDIDDTPDAEVVPPDNSEVLRSHLSYAINKAEYALNGINSGKNVMPPYFGIYQATPAQLIAVTPYPDKYDNIANVMAVSAAYKAKDLFAETANTILTAVMKLVISGVSIYDIAINTNILFDAEEDRLSKGQLLEIALAAMYVENSLSLANLSTAAECVRINDGRPIFTATAMGYAPARTLIPPEFKHGDKIFRLGIPRDIFGLPDVKYVLKLAAAININIGTGNITAARLIEDSVIKGVIKGTAGNGLGFSCVALDSLGLRLAAGDLLLAIDNIEEMSAFDCEYVGVVDDSGSLRNMDMSFERKDVNLLATTFDLAEKPYARVHLAPVTVKTSEPKRSRNGKAPILTVLHCDYSSEALIQSLAIGYGFKVNSIFIGADTEANIDLQRRVRETISASDMLVLAGRSAYGHYSTKNKIFDVLHKPAVLDAINKLLFVGDGLILGTGEGARALVELGYIPGGSAEGSETDNKVRLEASVGKSTAALMPKIRISNNFSPMLSEVEIGSCYRVAVAGQGMRLATDRKTICDMAFSGCIAGQFADERGFPTMAYPFNPTGSDMAVSAISSDSGKILGFFCLPEKTAYINNEPSLIKAIIKSAAKYYGNI